MNSELDNKFCLITHVYQNDIIFDTVTLHIQYLSMK